MAENKIKQIVFKNSFWIGIGEAFAKLAGFFVVIWIGRYFGPEIYGQWGFAFGFVVIFSIIADFGFSTFTTHELAKDKQKTSQYIDNIIFIKIFLGLITLGIIAIVVQFLDKDPVVISLIYFLAIYTVLNTFATFFQAIFRANQKMHYEAMARIIQGASLLLIVLFFIWKKDSILSISYAYIASTVIGIFFCCLFVWKYFTKFLVAIDFKILKQVLRQSWPFALSAVAIIIYYHIDLVFLGLFKNDAEVGYYNAAYNIVILLIVGIRMFIASLLPALSNLYKKSIQQFNNNINDFFKLILFSSLPFIIIIFFNTDLVIKIVYGNEYSEFTPLILQILIWSVLILYNYAVFSVGLTASDKQKIYLRGVLIGAVFNAITNLIFIPMFGFYGAAVTTVLTEMLVCCYLIRCFVRSSNFKLPVIYFIKIVTALTGMIIIIIILNYYNINFIISSLTGLIVYITAVLGLKTFKKSLLITFKNLLTS